jgi:hypothetical protein
VDWRHIIQIIGFSKTEEEVLYFETKNHEQNFKNISNVCLNEWYNEDEKKKDLLKKEYKNDIEHWEDNPDLMGDLTPLWEANEGRDNSFDNLKAIWENYELLYHCYNEEMSKNNPELSNWVRLYRTFNDSPRIGNISYTREMKGAWFSWANRNDNVYFEYLKNKEFLSLLLLEKDNLITDIKEKIRNKFPKEILLLNDDNFSSTNHLKAWMLIKVLYAKDKLLAFWDGRITSYGDGNGLASYDSCERNKLRKELPFSLGNSICGYAIKRKSGMEYAHDNNYWKNNYPIIAFDCSIGAILSVEEFNDRENRPISQEKIAEIDMEIQKLIAEFYQ